MGYYYVEPNRQGVFHRNLAYRNKAVKVNGWNVATPPKKCSLDSIGNCAGIHESVLVKVMEKEIGKPAMLMYWFQFGQAMHAY